MNINALRDKFSRPNSIERKCNRRGCGEVAEVGEECLVHELVDCFGCGRSSDVDDNGFCGKCPNSDGIIGTYSGLVCRDCEHAKNSHRTELRSPATKCYCGCLEFKEPL